MSVIKLPVSTFELTFVATILGRSMTYDVVHERFPSNGYHVAQYLSSGRAPCRVHLLAAAVCFALAFAFCTDDRQTNGQAHRLTNMAARIGRQLQMQTSQTGRALKHEPRGRRRSKIQIYLLVYVGASQTGLV